MTGQRLTVLAPLRVEARVLRSVLPDALVIKTGMGPRRARAAARSPGGPLAVAGFCGALQPGLAPGDVVVASEVRGPDGTVVPCPSGGLLMAALRRLGLPVSHGPVLSVERLAWGARRASLRLTGAVGVDLESAWLVRAAGTMPLAVLRVVTDGPEAELLRPALVRNLTRARRTLARAAPALAVWASACGARRVLLAEPDTPAALLAVARESDLLLMTGSDDVAASRLAQQAGCPIRVLNDHSELDPSWLAGTTTVALARGAATPDGLVEQLLRAIAGLGPVQLEDGSLACSTLPEEVAER
jgi:hypothetical protein